nr:DUF3332 family protein [Bacteroidota bacterium]
MKNFKTLLLSVSLASIILLQTGCIGSFQLTSNLYNWNKTEVGGKWGQELVFLAFVIIPVYEVTLLADGLVLNTIEFWTGDNPLALKDSEKDSKIVQNGDDSYLLTTEENKIHVEKIGGENLGENGDFIYDTETSQWVFTSENKVFNLE